MKLQPLPRDYRQVLSKQHRVLGSASPAFLGPSAAPQVFQSNVTSTSCIITWTSPPSPTWNGILKGFMVTLSDSNGTIKALNASANSTSLVFNNLTSFWNFTVEVRLINGYTLARTDYNRTIAGRVVFQTLPSMPGHVYNLHVQSQAARWAVIQWNRPELRDWNGQNRKKYFTLEEINGTSRDSWIADLDNNINVTYLIPFTDYWLTLSMYNEIGGGDPMSVLWKTNQSVPPMISDVSVNGIDDDWADLQWSAPIPPHGVIQHYELRVNSNWMNISGNEQTIRIPNLTINASYLIEIIACTGCESECGCSDPTQYPFVFIIHIPSAPPDFRVVESNDSSVVLAWTQPAGNAMFNEN